MNVCSKYEWMTLIHLAAAREDWKMAHLLLMKDASLMARCRRGFVALDLAKQHPGSWVERVERVHSAYIQQELLRSKVPTPLMLF